MKFASPETIDVTGAGRESELRQPAALEIKTRALLESGDTLEAETMLRRILRLAPGSPWAFDALVQLLVDAGREGDAEIVARETVALAPDRADAHSKLGVFLSRRNALVEGGWHFRQAIALGGRDLHLLLNLARNLKSQGQLAEAEALAIEASEKDPASLPALMLLAETAEQAGRMEAAEAALDRAAPLAQAQGERLHLPRTALLGRGARWREALELFDSLPDLPGVIRLARGRLREKAQRHDDAWQDYVEGKAAIAREQDRRYDRAEVERHFASIAQAFSAPFWKTVPKVATRADVPQPIFILGFPRSGTTMTEQVLATHSQIRAGGELPFALRLRDFAQQLLGRGLPFPAGIGELAAADYHHLPILFRDFYLALAETHGLTRPGVRFFTDKMPLNEVYLPLLRLAFPDAPMIAVQRHPLDILVSVMAHDLTHGFYCGYRLPDAAHQLAAVSQLMTHYRDVLRIALHALVYEQFIADQEGETARMMTHVGLEMEPAQLRFHESDRHAPTPSYAQVRQPVHAGSIAKWRPYAEQLAPVLPLVRDAMADGGYKL